MKVASEAGEQPIRSSAGVVLEDYYKWQLIHALVDSGLYGKDFIGTEVRFPKGSSSSAPIRLDAAIFDDASWHDHYKKYWLTRDSSELEWLQQHLVCAVECKRDKRDIKSAYSTQLKPAMKERDPSDDFVLGIYYDVERLFLFQRIDGKYLRYDPSKNQKGKSSGAGDLSLHLPDPYEYMPSFTELMSKTNKAQAFTRAGRTAYDLQQVTSIASAQMQDAFSSVLRALDKSGLADQRGYLILIQMIAMKIYDEKKNFNSANQSLNFYVEDNEAAFVSLNDAEAQSLILRMQDLFKTARQDYRKILTKDQVDWKNLGNVRAVAAIIQAFQDFSFIRSNKSDLYQLVFYNFANTFKRDEAGQFLTPIPVIDFIVQLVNPHSDERVIDPCCGIGDFLSLSYVNSLDQGEDWRLKDANIFGVDLDSNMISLATLNMLLNGDGEAKLFTQPDLGSILSKVVVAPNGQHEIRELDPKRHAKGNWDDWADSTELQKFDVVLTNPPFGDDRAFKADTQHKKDVLGLYETVHLLADEKQAKKTGKGKAASVDSIDLGVVFLENAYQLLKDGGRMGIVLSNSIASINRWSTIREWLVSKMRIVGVFDLPSNVFAETGVNTSIVVAYKPTPDELAKLHKEDYEFFSRDIKRVGYERRTSKRNVFFNPIFKIDTDTFEIAIDAEGFPVLDEEFSEVVAEFRQWVLTQEEALKEKFLQAQSIEPVSTDVAAL